MSSFYVQAQGRLLELEGVYNVSDLRGYAAADGKQVRWGMVYRSGDLHTLTARDVEVLQQRGIKTIVDFRTDGEREKFPHKLPSTLEHMVYLPIMPGNLMNLQTMNQEELALAMVQVNRDLVHEVRPQYRIFFSCWQILQTHHFSLTALRVKTEPAWPPRFFKCAWG